MRSTTAGIEKTGREDMTMHQDDKTKTARSVKQPRKALPKKQADAKEVFIDLDDAYGVPFSSVPVSMQDYRKKQNENHP